MMAVCRDGASGISSEPLTLTPTMFSTSCSGPCSAANIGYGENGHRSRWVIREKADPRIKPATQRLTVSRRHCDGSSFTYSPLVFRRASLRLMNSPRSLYRGGRSPSFARLRREYRNPVAANRAYPEFGTHLNRHGARRERRVVRVANELLERKRLGIHFGDVGRLRRRGT